MTSETHASLIEHAQRALGSAELVWLRRARIEAGFHRPVQALLSEAGAERWERALQQREYALAELEHAGRVQSQIARQQVLVGARPELAELQQTPLPAGVASITPQALWVEFLGHRAMPRGGTEGSRALLLALDATALRLVELRAEADQAAAGVAARCAPAVRLGATAAIHALLAAGLPPSAAANLEAMFRAGLPPEAAQELVSLLTAGAAPAAATEIWLPQLAKAADQRRDSPARISAGLQPSAASEALRNAPGRAQAAHEATPHVFTLPEPAQRAADWLAQTDDAAHDMLSWLLRNEAAQGKGFGDLLLALRASRFDGLARPAERMQRLSLAARRLGFERIMNSRLRVERAVTLLAPRAALLALDVPHDVRVAAPSVEYGLISDLTVAAAIGSALCLALASTEVKPCLRWPLPTHSAHALGALFGQFRADRAHLVRVAGFDRPAAEQAARHSAIILLLRTRLAAAFARVDAAEPNNRERLARLQSAAARALGCEISEGVAALLWFNTADAPAEFSALDCGLALHAALRERFDEDFYLNPRVSEVLQGAAARGHLLDERTLREELGAGSTLGAARALELLA